MRFCAGLVIVGLALGCDRPSGQTPTPAEKKGKTYGVDVTSVTPLPPGRRTHVAPTERGQVFWVQEAEDGGRETVFAIGEGGLPAATRFGTAAVAEALKEPGATGSIQSLAASRDGTRVYFYFNGGKGKKILAAFGEFTPTTGQARILMQTAALAGESGMGNALVLARGTIVRSGDVVWLWLRHDDGYALLSMDETRVGATLRRGFDRVKAAGGGEGPELTSGRDDLSAAAGALIYLDRRDGRVWRIEPLGGATVAHELADLPRETTVPTPDERGRLVTFAPDGPRFNEKTDDLIGEGLAAVTRPTGASVYPALVVLDGARREVLGRAAFSAPGTMNVRGLSVARLVRDRSAWLGYDPLTGELLRFKVVER